MSSAALKQLTDLHRNLYERAYAEACETMGDASLSISKYAQAFSNSLPNTFKITKARRISQAIDQHRVILYGDFHSHKQCQRALLRVIRTYNNTPDHAPMALALEMFRTENQETLNQWQEGRISDEELLDQTNYDTIWGFPWANYRPLLDYCRSNGIPLYAANTKNAGKDHLQKRDIHAAELICKLVDKSPSLRVFYIVGEYHLADSHLPAELLSIDKDLKFMRIIANSDKYYFDMPHDRIHRRDIFLELNQSFFCILNSPPWMKWQSQTLVEELKNMGASTYIQSEISSDQSYSQSDEDDFEDEEDDLYNEDTIDLDSHLRLTVQNIAQFLKIKNSSNLQDSFKILPSIDSEDVDHLPPHARAIIFEQASREGVASDFQKRILFLSEISINNLAFASGLVIFGSLSNLREDYDSPDQLFFVQTLKLTFGHLANKILNPRVSYHTRKAVEDYIGATKGRHIAGQRKLRRDIARSAIKFLKWAEFELDSNRAIGKISKPVPSEILDIDTRSSHDVCRHVAQILASAIYTRLIAGKIDPIDLGKWFSKRCDTKLRVRLLLAELFQYL